MVSQGVWTQEDINHMKMPICLRPGTMSSLYQKMQFLQDYMIEHPDATHNDLFCNLQPELFFFYNSMLNETDSILDAFENIFESPDFQDSQGMKNAKIDGKTVFQFMNNKV